MRIGQRRKRIQKREGNGNQKYPRAKKTCKLDDSKRKLRKKEKKERKKGQVMRMEKHNKGNK